MRTISAPITIVLILLISVNCSLGDGKFVLAVHGGAGSYNRTLVTTEKEMKIKLGILEALKAGYFVLKSEKGNHLDAAREAIIRLEDNPIFNAGKGGKINRKFEVELDASIMDGSNLNCGAVGGVKSIKNPIIAAELVMQTTPHIFLIADGADNYAAEKGLTMVPNSYFFTQERIDEWNEARKKKSAIGRMGTVGAVALDKRGHLSAATSTGGITYKMEGRIGDSPIIGAGNYANDETCAVSCTGEGEVMMKRVMAFDIHARMKYKGYSLSQAAQEVMSEVNPGTGGFISVDKYGNVEMPYNSSGMARGYVRQDGRAFIFIFNEGEDTTPTEFDLLNF